MIGGDLANLARLLAAENELESSPGAATAQSEPSGPQR